ncbi:MAG: 1-phosphofructokinase [Enterobacteriaceae bacterium]
MKSKVATITLNPAYDLVGHCQQVLPQELNLVQTIGFHPAGKGINVAMVLRDLALDVAVGGFLGQDNQKAFCQLLQQKGITNDFTQVAGATRHNIKLTDDNGAVTEFNFSGFTISDQEWQRFARESLAWLASFQWVAVSGSLPPGVQVQDFSRWLQQVTACCPYTVFDSSQQALQAGLQAKPWLIKPNLKELEALFQRSMHSVQEVAEAARQLHEKGICHVVVSLGAEGALWSQEECVWLAKPPHSPVVSSVGAGDSMVAGLICGLSQGMSTEHTLRLATAAATLAVGQCGVGIRSEKRLKELMEQVIITRV